MDTAHAFIFDQENTLKILFVVQNANSRPSVLKIKFTYFYFPTPRHFSQRTRETRLSLMLSKNIYDDYSEKEPGLPNIMQWV